MPDISLPHIEWRDGRPRFKPSPRLAKLGFKRENLTTPGGEWMTLPQAQAWLAGLDARIAGAKAPQPQDARPTKRRGTGRRLRAPLKAGAGTVAELFEHLWLEPQFHAILKNGKPNPSVLAPKTIADYRSKASWLSRFDPELWGSQARAVTRQVAKGLHQAMWSERGLPQANAVVAVLRLCWSSAYDHGRVSEQPFSKMKLRAAPPRLRIGTPAEIAALLAAADGIDPETGEPRDPEIGDAIVLALYTGQRQADCLELAEDRIDDRLRFRQNKTDARVSVRPIPQLVARLAEARERRAAIAADLKMELPPNVVISRHTGTPIVGSNCSHRFAVVRAAAVKVVPSLADFCFMDLRDTAVTRLASAGCTLPQICAITGHALKSATEIMRHYLELNGEQADAAMDKLEAWLGAQGIEV